MGVFYGDAFAAGIGYFCENKTKVMMRFTVFVLVISLWACNGQPAVKSVDEQSLKAEIEQITNELKQATTTPIDKKKGQKLVDKSVLFAESFPQHADTPAYLFQAGEVSRSIGAHETAVEIFKKVHMEYPRHKRAPAALFLQAFTFENDMKNIEKARKLYKDFLYKFSDDPLVEQVNQILSVIDKSPEEMVKEFRARAKKEE